MRKLLVVGLLSFLSVGSLAANSGKILEISIASTVAHTVRPGSVQFAIAGGFSEFGDCDTSLAAITREDEHLLSLLLMAKASNKEVEVHLDSNSKYYGSRCLVSYLEII